MAIGNIQNYNKIIELTFKDTKARLTTIRCPLRGRKPSIEINGTFTTKNFLPAFNVTVKNLYLTLSENQYTKLKVKAGYETDYVEFEGTILTMYQESPGPEGNTIIQCQQGDLQEWMNATVQLDFKKGTSITNVIDQIKSSFSIYDIKYGQQTKLFKLPEDMVFDGTARQAIDELCKLFKDEELVIVIRNNSLCVFSINQGDAIAYHKLKYLSAPPQENAGDSANGTYYTTLNAPWQPKLQIGDKVEIPAKAYIKNFQAVSTASKTQIIQVTTLQFHFGTTSSANSMTIQGFNTKL